MATQVDERIKNAISLYTEMQSTYCSFAELVLKKIIAALNERNILIAYSSSRAKSITSYSEKCKKTVYDREANDFVLKYSNPRNQITDCAGVRIVAYLLSDIPQIQSVIENMFHIDDKNSENKLSQLVDNKVGYLSVHYIAMLKNCSYDEQKFSNLKCEIQIRTILQDAWAQIFHDRQYKNSVPNIIIPDTLLRKTSLIAGALELIDQQITDLVSKYDALAPSMDNIKYQSLLDKGITDDSLFYYFNIKFKGKVQLFFDSDSSIKLLKHFKLNTIRDLDNIIPQKLVEETNSYPLQLTIDRMIILILLVFDYKKYFEICKDNYIKEISGESYSLLNKFIDIESICKEYKIKNNT